MFDFVDCFSFRHQSWQTLIQRMQFLDGLQPSQANQPSIVTASKLREGLQGRWFTNEEQLKTFRKKSQQPNLRISFAIINFQNFYLLFFSLMLYLLFRFWRKSFFLFYFRMQKPGLDEREYLMRITKFWILNFFQFYFWTLAKKASRKTGGKIINY